MRLVLKAGRAAYDLLIRSPLGFGKPIARAAWEADYAAGNWDHLGRDSESARFAIISALIKTYVSNAHVLDVGCGEGILRTHLRAGDFLSFTGIDLSRVAVEKALAKGCDASTFLEQDFSEFVTDEKYNVVVFNEVIYYAVNPLELFIKYWIAVPQGGFIIVSMLDYNTRTRAIWRRLRRWKVPKYSIRIGDLRGQTWDIGVFEKSGPE